jgi:hypothetical protein
MSSNKKVVEEGEGYVDWPTLSRAINGVSEMVCAKAEKNSMLTLMHTSFTRGAASVICFKPS